jgi:L-arabinonolactonase
MLHEHTLTLALAQAHELGEGVHWHAGSGRWWWTDIEGSTLYAWTPGATATLQLRMPERVGCFVHGRSGALLLGMAKRLARVVVPDPLAVGVVELQPREILPVEPDLPTTRINDGRCDRSGALVFGTLDEGVDGGPRRPIGSFYQYSRAHGLRRLALGHVAVANSICFSPDGRLMYYADSPTGRIMVCDYDAGSASVGTPRLFALKAPGEGYPDGSVIDAQGCLWNAEWANGSVARYSPEGRLLARHGAPAPHVSCPALGGPAGDQLLVTSARQELSSAQLMAMPLSGSLFGMPVAPGLALPEPLFEDG